MNKSAVLLFALLVVILAAGFFYFESSDSNLTNTPDNQTTLADANDKVETAVPGELLDDQMLLGDGQTELLADSQTETNDFNQLGLVLTGIAYSLDSAQSSAVIEHAGLANTYSIGQSIGNSNAVLMVITQTNVLVEFAGDLHELGITSRQSDIANISDNSDSVDMLDLPMTAEEIGNRPRVLEHIVTLPSERYFGEPPSVAPGINPKLFESAGFEEGDELLTINDMDITDLDLIDDIQTMIREAHSLKFEVMRGGRKVTLFLDIPSETLKIN